MKRGLWLNLILFLVAGASINVAVAWALAVTLNVFNGGAPHQWRQIRTPGLFWQGQSKCRAGGIWMAARFVRTTDDLIADTASAPGEKGVPSWSGFNEPTKEFSAKEIDAVWRWGDGRGWPALCLGSETKRYNDTNATRTTIGVQWGIETQLPEWGGGNPHNMGPRVLPLKPIWPGFAINTIFYAALLWVLFAAPFKIRRWRRIKRGQCASCGYSLRESVSEKCPECGATA